MKVGIDFGSCYSFISVIDDKEVIENFVEIDNLNGIPTLFMMRGGKEYFGDQCLVEYQTNPKNIVSDMKQKIRDDLNNCKKKVSVDQGVFLRYDEVIEKYIHYLIGLANDAAKGNKGLYLNERDLESITITAPVAPGDNSSEYKEFLQQSVVNATGLPTNRVHILEEPFAAAISYLNKNHEKIEDGEQTVLVFDLGGSTLDVAVVSCDYSDNEYRPIEKGYLEIGGTDWDRKLFDLILDELNISEKDLSPEDKAKMEREVERTKIRLSDSDSSLFTFSKYLPVEITRSDFEECTKDLLNEAMSLIRSVYDSAREDVHRIVLVGGGCNMPQIVNGIKTTLSDIIDPSTIELFDPSHAIANGAAYYNELTMDIGGVSRRGSVQDFSSHTYGINIFPTADADCFSIYNMIFKGDQFDSYGRIRALSEFVVSPANDSYRKIKFEVYESDLDRSDCDPDGIIEMGHSERSKGIVISVAIPEEYYGKATMYELRIELILTSDQILEVVVRDSAGIEVDHKKKKFSK